jgi:LmbE family N-acetylglucosaminyl deacetylase
VTADAMPAVPEPPATGPRSCLLFVAHPDDDAIFAGALQRRAVDAGATFTVVCLTHADGSPRAEELRAWQRGLGTDPARVHFLGFEDDPEDRRQGRCSIDASVVLAAVRALGLRPDVVVTHNARGEYGHPHHLLVHRVARAAFPDVVRLEFGEGVEPPDVSVACGDKWAAVAATFASQRSVVATFARATEGSGPCPREAAGRSRPGGSGGGRGAADGRARGVPSDGAAVVREDAGAADAAAGARVAGDRDGRARARGRADRLGQDARGVPDGGGRVAAAGAGARRRDVGALRLAAEGARQRHAEEPARAAGGLRRSTRRCPRCASSCELATRPRRSARR